MSLDDVISAMQALGMKKDDMWEPLEWTDFGWKEVDKAMDNITDKGGILNSLFASLGNGVKSLGTAFKGFLLSPAAKIVGAIIAIGAAIKFLDAVITTPKEATEAMTESFGEFENARNEVENLNSELQNTKNSISDLQAKGNLSLVEKEELKNLKEAEKSLEMQKKIAEEMSVDKARQAAQSAAVAYEKNFRHEISEIATDNYLKNANGSAPANLLGDADNISSMIAGIKQYTQLRDKAIDDAETWNDYNEVIQDTTASIWEQANALMEQKTNLEASKKAIEDNGGRLTDYQQNALDNITASLDYIYKEMSPETWKQMQIDDLFATDQFSNTKQELTELAKEYSNLTDFTNAAISAYGDFNTALLSKGIKMSDIAEGIFSEAGIIDTEAVRQQLIGLNESFTNWANQLSDEELKLAYKIILETDEANFTLDQWKNTLEEYKANQALDHDVVISVEQEGLEKVNAAIAESASETGLLTETIDSLKSRYRALESFDADKLFENTANGVKLNTKELTRLEDAYAKLNIDKLNDALKVAEDRYHAAALAAELNTNPQFANAYKVRAENALEEIEAIEQLIAQYEALNGVYGKALKAAETPNAGVMLDNTKSLYNTAKELRKAGKVNTDDFKSFVELVKGDLGDTAGLDDYVKAFDSFTKKLQVEDTDGKLHTLSQSINSFFADGQIGAKNFVNALKQAGKVLGQNWITDNKDGTFELNVDSSSVAEALHISEELVDILFMNLSQYLDIDLDPAVDSSKEVKENIEKAEETLENFKNEANKTNIKPIEIDVNNKSITNLEDQLSSVEAYIKRIQKLQKDGTISKGYGDALLAHAEQQLRLLYVTIQNQQGLQIDPSTVADGYGEIAQKVNEYQQALIDFNVANAFGNTEEAEAALTKIKEICAEITQMDKAEELGLKFDIDKDGQLEQLQAQLAKGVDFPIKLPPDSQLDAIVEKITNLENKDITVTVTVNGDVEKVTQLAEAINKLSSKDVVVSSNANGESNSTADGTINYELGDVALPEGMVATGTINYELGSVAKPEGMVATGTINYVLGSVAKPGGAGADGTAWSSGSAFVNGLAFARGNWGTKDSGVAFGGELGQELVVRNGRFFTIGDKSAEFFQYKKNDIIFNAEQTKQILNQGRITRGHRRGRALADGTVHTPSGRAFWSGSGNKFYGTSSGNGNSNNSGNYSESYNEVPKGVFSWVNKLFRTIEETKQYRNYIKELGDSSTFVQGYYDGLEKKDWIEVAIKRIEEAIERMSNAATSAFKSLEVKLASSTSQIDLINKEIAIQEAAYKRYMQEANSVNLTEHTISKIQDGSIDISYYDEDGQKRIDEYTEWYEKAIECADAIDELKESLAECYQVAFDNIVSHYDGILSMIEHEKNMLDESIAQSEAKGYIVSAEYYQAMLKNEQENIRSLEEEINALIVKRDDALNSGVIVKGSEAWFEMENQINEVTVAIEEANTSVIEIGNSIRDIEWQIFDLLQEKISNITKETDFLINLLDSDELYDENGRLNNIGLSAIGLHGQNYNTYMAQADMYANEIEKLNSQIADDPFNQDLINRRQELLELQQDNILAAEDEKQAIVDLVQDGIDLELESLQELIDKYKEKLNIQKDLYDYNKELEEQTKEIATLEKQLAAYHGNESEEIKAKVQQIKVSLEEAKSNLEETQYDRFISDQEKLLDELYSEYEEVFNERLDNLDTLISNLIDDINSNSSSINTVLSEKADTVGYTISDSIKEIWSNENGAKNVITQYRDDFLAKSTTTNNILNAINSNIMSMVSQLNVLAETDINGIPSADEHATGIRKVPSDEVSWTQEDNKQEYIVRPSDGAILTPVAQDDDILNSQASSNIWNMANNPADFIRNNLVGSTPTPVVKSNNQSFVQHFDKIVFSMPNITSYSEMLNEMKHDKKFEKLVTAMTIDRLAGKSHLGVGKSF